MVDKQPSVTRADSFAAHNSKLANNVVAEVAIVSLQEPEGEDITVAAACPWTSST
jgi:hypothetical protein